MKKESLLSAAMVVGVASMFIALSSCEWDRATDEASWNSAYESKYEWVNFSGVYQNTGGWYVVTQFRRPNSGGGGGGGGGGTSVAGAQTVTVGTGNDTQRSFGGSVSPTPIMAGTFSIRATIQPAADVEVFSDSGNDGLLHSSQVGNTSIGFINYYTGAFSVQFLFPVISNVDVVATYVSGTSPTQTNITVTTTQRPRPGSSRPIFQFLITQDGYRLTIRDDYGSIYTGRIIEISSTAGGVATDIRPGEAVTVIATFEASGNDVTMTGTLEGTYTAAQEDTTIDPAQLQNPTQNEETDYRGTLENRVMRGVWVEDNGVSGEIEGVSAEPVAISGGN